MLRTICRVLLITWRWFSGAHLDGRRRTNATWLKPGTRPSHHVNWWTKKPRLHRAGYRWLIFLVVTSELALWLGIPKIAIVVNAALIPFLVERTFRHAKRLRGMFKRRVVVDNVTHYGDLDDLIVPADITDAKNVRKIKGNEPLFREAE